VANIGASCNEKDCTKTDGGDTETTVELKGDKLKPRRTL
jgi:hypothetical protein